MDPCSEKHRPTERRLSCLNPVRPLRRAASNTPQGAASRRSAMAPTGVVSACDGHALRHWLTCCCWSSRIATRLQSTPKRHPGTTRVRSARSVFGTRRNAPGPSPAQEAVPSYPSAAPACQRAHPRQHGLPVREPPPAVNVSRAAAAAVPRHIRPRPAARPASRGSPLSEPAEPTLPPHPLSRRHELREGARQIFAFDELARILGHARRRPHSRRSAWSRRKTAPSQQRSLGRRGRRDPRRKTLTRTRFEGLMRQ